MRGLDFVSIILKKRKDGHPLKFPYVAVYMFRSVGISLFGVSDF